MTEPIAQGPLVPRQGLSPVLDGRSDIARPAGIMTARGGRGGARLLWTHVEETRGRTAELRSAVNINHASLARSRWDCLDALQAYADCLTDDHRPLPYQLRDELRLLLLTCVTDSRH